MEQRHLGGEVGQAGVPLGRGRLVGGRSAPDDGGDVAVAQRQPVVRRHARRLVGVAGPVQGGEQPVARPVAGEHATGAVPPVGGRRQPDDQQAGGRVAEAGDRTSPVVLVGEGGPLVPRHLLPPRDQPWATAARHDLGRQRGERACLRGCHDDRVG